MANNKAKEEEVKEPVNNTESQNEENVATSEESTVETSDEATTENTQEQKELNALKEAEEKYSALNDKYLRLYSDFDNHRRRSAKEKIELLDRAGSDIVLEMLSVIDDFERAIKNNETVEDIESLKEGFQLIYNKLFKTLENKGLKPMDSIGTDFDTDLHEAITNIPAPSEDMKGKVVDVAEKGYLLRDKVIRYAKVIIGQ